MKWIYQMNRVRVSRGDKLILDDVTLAFLPGAKIGVVGPNGAGKSTLLKIMAGVEQPSNGEVTLASGASVGILLQEPPLDESKTVLGNVEQGVAQTLTMLIRFTALTPLLAEDCSDELLAEMGRLHEQLDLRGAWDLDSRLEQAMDALRCPPGEAEVGSLSGGERRRVALCALLLRQPDLLLLDEPTNDLDVDTLSSLENALLDFPGCALITAHDRWFLDRVATHILAWEGAHDHPGRWFWFEGNFEGYANNKIERLGAETARPHRVTYRKLTRE
jgi:ATPase subunit of ABC transporter with duplicated ATPase domains